MSSRLRLPSARIRPSASDDVQRRDELDRPRRAICSQLVDEAYRAASGQLFTDMRPPAYFTPGSLWWRAAQFDDVCVL